MSVVMKELKEYTIQFIGLKQGEHNFDFRIDNTFFKNFEYEEFNKVDVETKLKLIKKSTLLELHFSVLGHVNINCDLTNEPYNQMIQDNFKLVVKFGAAHSCNIGQGLDTKGFVDVISNVLGHPAHGIF